MSTRTQLRVERPSALLPSAESERNRIAWALRDTPATWFLLGKAGTSGSARTHAWQIRTAGKGWSMFGDGFQAEAHSMLGEHRVYARWADTGAVSA